MYAAGGALTSSLYSIDAAVGPVTARDSTTGGIPSVTLAAAPGGRRLPAASATGGADPEYRSTTPDGAVPPPSPPSSVSASVSEPPDMSDLASTRRPAESPPDTDQPPGPDVPAALTGSSNVTSSSVGEDALAPEIEGACPSASATSVVPSPYLSIKDMRTEPVALGGAGGSPKASSHVSSAMRLDETTLRGAPSMEMASGVSPLSA